MKGRAGRLASLHAVPFARALAVGMAFAATAGCDDSTKKETPRVHSLGVKRPTTNQGVPQPLPDEAENAASSGPAATHVAIEPIVEPPVMYNVKVKVDAAPKVDPDQVVVANAQKAAGECFTGISDGTTTRFASIHVLVLPSGTVSRAEVSAPTTHEDSILGCLQGVGDGLRFSDKPDKPGLDLRNFTISVSVSRAH